MQHADALDAVTGLAADGNQFLTFALGDEEYALDILRVQEIKGHTAITPIPNVPAYVRGVMNLRGTVVPVVDLRRRFGMPEAAYDKFSVIVVVTVGPKVIGLLVDAVSDVLNFPRGEIEPTPGLGAGVDTSCIAGMAKSGEKIVVLLDVDQVVDAERVAVPAAAS